jgi:hypothetical protein
MGREGERKGGGRGYGVGFYRRQLFLVLTIVLNNKRYFKISLLVIFTQSYFETLANIEIACSEIFLLSNGFSGAHDFCSNNSDVFHSYAG